MIRDLEQRGYVVDLTFWVPPVRREREAIWSALVWAEDPQDNRRAESRDSSIGEAGIGISLG